MKPRIYLAGGMRSDWQDRVMRAVGADSAIWLDPRKCKLKEPALYVPRDLKLVGSSHIVFAYMERTNPSGFGLSVEVGYAAGHGVWVVGVNEKYDRLSSFWWYACSYRYRKLICGIRKLKDILADFEG